jgi:hypothetical protein
VQSYLVSAEQSSIYVGKISFRPDYLHWGFPHGQSPAKKPIVTFIGSKAYDVATTKGRLDAAEFVVKMLCYRWSGPSFGETN